jgi:hypothetical protein
MLLAGLRSLYALPVTLILVEVSTNVALFCFLLFAFFQGSNMSGVTCAYPTVRLTVNPINDSDIVRKYALSTEI